MAVALVRGAANIQGRGDFAHAINNALFDVAETYEYSETAGCLSPYMDALNRKPEVVAKRLAEIGKGLPR